MIIGGNLTEEIFIAWKNQEGKLSYNCHWQWNKNEDAMNDLENTNMSGSHHSYVWSENNSRTE